MAPRRDPEVAAAIVAARVEQEWSLKESLERRAQFLVGAAATGSSLVVAGAALLTSNGSTIGSTLESLLIVAAVIQIAVGIASVLVLMPLALRTADQGSLKSMVEAADRHDAEGYLDSNAVTAGSRVELELLGSLEKQNGSKVILLFIASLGEIVALVVLGFAVAQAIDTY